MDLVSSTDVDMHSDVSLKLIVRSWIQILTHPKMDIWPIESNRLTSITFGMSTSFGARLQVGVLRNLTCFVRIEHCQVPNKTAPPELDLHWTPHLFNWSEYDPLKWYLRTFLSYFYSTFSPSTGTDLGKVGVNVYYSISQFARKARRIYDWTREHLLQSQSKVLTAGNRKIFPNRYYSSGNDWTPGPGIIPSF